MKQLDNKVVQLLTENDYTISEIYDQGNEFFVELETYSPAGENVIATVFFDGTTEDFIKQFRKYAEDFDTDEHAKMWIDGRGKNGVPSTIRELIDDADAIKQSFSDLADKLEQIEEI